MLSKYGSASKSVAERRTIVLSIAIMLFIAVFFLMLLQYFVYGFSSSSPTVSESSLQ